MPKRFNTTEALSGLRQKSFELDGDKQAEALAAVAALVALLQPEKASAIGRSEQIFSILDESRDNGRMTAETLKTQLQQLDIKQLTAPQLNHLETIYAGIVGWELGRMLKELDEHIATKLGKIDQRHPLQLSKEQVQIINDCISASPDLSVWLRQHLAGSELSPRFKSRINYLKAFHSIQFGDLLRAIDWIWGYWSEGRTF